MRLGPKALQGLGRPSALRPYAPDKGVGGPAWLAAFMAGQSEGFWFGFTKIDRLFQENVGPTPADDPSEVLGLALSQRTSSTKTLAQVVSEATEQLSNPDFTSNITGWTNNNVNATVTWDASGAALLDVISGSGGLRSNQTIALTVGRSYRLALRIKAVTFSGSIALRASAVTVSTIALTSNYVDYVAYFTASEVSPIIDIIRSTASTGTMLVDSISIKEVSRYGATQATGSFKPTVQAGGARGDATDDRLVTGFASSSSGDAFNVYPAAIIPASLAATQVFAGAMDGSSNGDYLAITTGGALRAKVGATTLDSTGIDLRGGTHDLAYWTDGATLYLYADGAIVASGPWTGSRPTTAWNLFALNNNGTASNFTEATMKAALRGSQALTVSLANQICRAA